jgi:hypothetical protein
MLLALDIARGHRRWAIRWATRSRTGLYLAHSAPPATLSDAVNLQVLSGSMPSRTPCFTRERSQVRNPPRPSWESPAQAGFLRLGGSALDAPDLLVGAVRQGWRRFEAGSSSSPTWTRRTTRRRLSWSAPRSTSGTRAPLKARTKTTTTSRPLTPAATDERRMLWPYPTAASA